jgi:hypothetical protein
VHDRALKLVFRRQCSARKAIPATLLLNRQFEDGGHFSIEKRPDGLLIDYIIHRSRE